MITFTIILCLLIINSVYCKDCVLDNGSRDLHEEVKLHNDILCNYDMFESPTNTTLVKLHFFLKYFYFNSNEEILTTYSLLNLEWMDERLKWDPKNYDGITQSQLNSDRIWTPTLSHMARTVYDNYDDMLVPMCEGSNTGLVNCMLKMYQETECSRNLTHWPYDTQTCTFKYGADTYYKSNYVLTFNSSRGISMLGAEYGPGWTIIDFKKEEKRTSKTQFCLTFVIERQAESLETVIIVPSIVLSVLTISSLFLEVNSIRGGIVILSLLGHIYIQKFLNETIPKNVSTLPLILNFLTASLVITIVTITLSMLLSNLLRKKLPPQQWVVSINEVVFKSPLKFLVWSRWQAKNFEPAVDETQKDLEDWVDFAYFINNVSIIIVVIAYITILSSFMPKPLPIDFPHL